MRAVYHVIGPPGTGKTTRLMEVLDGALQRYVPLEVGATTFTRAGVHEIWQRAEAQFDLDLRPRHGGRVGTVHSLCLHGLGGVKVFSAREWGRFCREHRIPYTDSPLADDDILEPWEPTGTLEGDLFRAWYDWARNGLLDLEEAAHLYDPGYTVDMPPLPRLLHLARLYEEAKRQAGMLDFCDLLLVARDRGLRLGVRCLLVDEAQDLSPLQRQIVLLWAEEAQEVWFFYDPDQTIYTWQHADPRWLLEMPGQREYLSQSYRVPRRIAALAQAYIARNQTRYDHTFRPRDAEGAVLRSDVGEIASLIESDGAGTWGLLVRNRFYLSQFTLRLMAAGIPYINLRGVSPMGKGLPTGVVAALRLASGEAVTLRELRLMAELMRARGNWRNRAELDRLARATPDQRVTLRELPDLGASPELLAALGGGVQQALARLTAVPAERRHYYWQVFRRGGIAAFIRQPQVTVSTIHGVKGREFDHVALLPDWTRRTRDAADDDPEAERRVWYVAMTRARERLVLLEPTGRNYNYELV